MLSESLQPVDSVDLVGAARERGARLRPPVGGFPVLAEALRSAGIHTVHCDVASMTTVYRLAEGIAVIDQGTPLTQGLSGVARFDRDAVIAAIRRDQRGESTYPDFMADIWHGGVLTYDIELAARTCTYYGIDPAQDVYVEEYALVSLDG